MGQTATSASGERIEWDGKAWVPLVAAPKPITATNTAGEKITYQGGRWQRLAPEDVALAPPETKGNLGKVLYPMGAALAGVGGLPNAALEAGRWVINQGIRSGTGPYGLPVPKQEVPPTFLERHTYSPQEIASGLQSAGLPMQRAETGGGRVAQDVATGALAALPTLPAGGLPGMALSAAAGGASGGLREAGAPESVQVLAGVLLPLVGFKLGGFLLRSTPIDLLSSALKAGATKTEFEAAAQRMQGGATFPEAINQVTNGRFPKLLAYQRVTERAAGGQEVMGPFMAGRLGQNKAAIDQNIGTLPGGQAAEAVPSQVQQGAKDVIQQARDETNAASKAAYDATANNPAALLSQPRMVGLLQDSNVADAIKGARASPIKYGDLAGVPDNSLKVLDAAKKYADDVVGAAVRSGERAAISNASDTANKIKDAIVAENPRYASALNIQSIRQANVEAPLQRGAVGQIAEGQATLPDIRNTLGLTSRTETPLVLSPVQVGAAVKSIADKQPSGVPDMLGQIMSEDFQNTVARTRPGFGMEQAGTTWRYRLFGSKDSVPERRWEAAVENSGPGGPEKWKGMQVLLDNLDSQGYRLPPGSNTAADSRAMSELEQSRLPNPLSPGEVNPLSSKGWLSQKWDDYFFSKNSKQMATLLTEKKNAPYWAALAKLDSGSAAATKLVNAMLGATVPLPQYQSGRPIRQ